MTRMSSCSSFIGHRQKVKLCIYIRTFPWLPLVFHLAPLYWDTSWSHKAGNRTASSPPPVDPRMRCWQSSAAPARSACSSSSGQSAVAGGCRWASGWTGRTVRTGPRPSGSLSGSCVAGVSVNEENSNVRWHQWSIRPVQQSLFHFHLQIRFVLLHVDFEIWERTYEQFVSIKVIITICQYLTWLWFGWVGQCNKIRIKIHVHVQKTILFICWYTIINFLASLWIFS